MDSRAFYCAGVSSKEQRLKRRVTAFLRLLERKSAGNRHRQESGKDLERTGYQALKSAMLRHGNTIGVKSLYQLSRNKPHIHNEHRFFEGNGILMKVIDLTAIMMKE